MSAMQPETQYVLRGQRSGVYIAHHHWLDREAGPGQLHKLGHSGDLRQRLSDSAYITCFPPGWRYVATFETKDKKDAAALEGAVLGRYCERRLGQRELILSPAPELAAAVAHEAAALGIAIEPRTEPKYEPPERRETAPMEMAPSAPADTTPIAPTETPIEAAPETAPTETAPTETTPTEAAPETVSETAPIAPLAPIEEREYQVQATEDCRAELKARGSAVLQMACRCGKTRVAYQIAKAYMHEGPVLFLVPGLSLLRQTAQKLTSYICQSDNDPSLLLVGSDTQPVPVYSRSGTKTLSMTTNPAQISQYFDAKTDRSRIVVSTYQSSPLIPDPGRFSLIIFDECHRICGKTAPRAFNHVLLATAGGKGPARLFMTATPSYEGELSMRDRDKFGGVAFRYYLQQGIAAGYVNDFRLELVAAPPAVNAPDTLYTTPSQIIAAMGRVDKLLVFCRDIASASRLCAAVREASLGSSPGVPPFACLEAHSRMASGHSSAALQQFSAEGRAALFNCRLFQEGVEIPLLNGVFYAAPRHSFRDIIQSLCRPLNKMPGKPPSVAFIPIAYDAKLPANDPANLKRFASIIPLIDALLHEDPRLYEHLLNPESGAYPLDILGTRSLKLDDGASRAALLGAVRRAMRFGASKSARPVDRLLRPEAIPWDRVYAELSRVVRTCNRYPKTTEQYAVGEARANLHTIYRHYATRYARFKADETAGISSDALEPYQARALEALPGWVPFGVEGPYPWGLCMDFLEKWLETHAGVPPMLNINNGGFVGLNATFMERLSGAMTCVNQGDGKERKGKPPGSGFTISEEKQADLDRICARFGLKWRKARSESGALVARAPRTMIQESYERFKSYYKLHGANGEYIRQWYPGYPDKHRKCEEPEVLKAGVTPLRRPARPRSKPSIAE